MMAWVPRHAGSITPRLARLLDALLVAVMTRFAERLPVRAPPEQNRIAAMRDDVVNHRRRPASAELHALGT